MLLEKYIQSGSLVGPGEMLTGQSAGKDRLGSNLKRLDWRMKSRGLLRCHHNVSISLYSTHCYCESHLAVIRDILNGINNLEAAMNVV